MELEIKYWEAVILSNKNYEPKNKVEEAAYDIAEFYLSREKSKKVAA